ncbi:MAG: four-helix bundle copper-binding protein [Acidimicrobiia bacterium]|nr:four-helix bundle copper-binding protein [Acidimicrobiia bacterium]
MSDAARMLLASAHLPGIDTAVLAECIDAADTCAQSCTACADACLHEYDLRRECVHACATGADVCETTARVLSRASTWDLSVVTKLLETRVRACSSAAGHCEGHADTAKHCAICAESCRRCEKACQQLLTALAALMSALPAPTDGDAGAGEADVLGAGA